MIYLIPFNETYVIIFACLSHHTVRPLACRGRSRVQTEEKRSHHNRTRQWPLFPAYSRLNVQLIVRGSLRGMATLHESKTVVAVKIRQNNSPGKKPRFPPGPKPAHHGSLSLIICSIRSPSTRVSSSSSLAYLMTRLETLARRERLPTQQAKEKYSHHNRTRQWLLFPLGLRPDP